MLVLHVPQITLPVVSWFEEFVSTTSSSTVRPYGTVGVMCPVINLPINPASSSPHPFQARNNPLYVYPSASSKHLAPPRESSSPPPTKVWQPSHSIPTNKGSARLQYRLVSAPNGITQERWEWRQQWQQPLWKGFVSQQLTVRFPPKHLQHNMDVNCSFQKRKICELTGDVVCVHIVFPDWNRFPHGVFFVFLFTKHDNFIATTATNSPALPWKGRQWSKLNKGERAWIINWSNCFPWISMAKKGTHSRSWDSCAHTGLISAYLWLTLLLIAEERHSLTAHVEIHPEVCVTPALRLGQLKSNQNQPANQFLQH